MSRIQKLTSKSKFDDTCDFYIMNAINVPKMGKNFFKQIGTCVVDELHLIMAEGLSKSLQIISPRYLIGLSATPYRNDGLDGLINFFFGEDKIVRKLYRKHIVYKVDTGLKIDMEITESTGKVNWGAVLKTQSDNKERNDLIIRIVQHFKDRNFLILCKRVEQANYFIKNLKEKGEFVDSLVGSKQEFDRESRILVGILSKVGTGFDWSKSDALMLACDLESFFIQSLGRVFRAKDNIPIVFDILDSNPILIKHYKTRLETYKECGGTVKSFNKEFPELIQN
jgi:superfamily II DNA or RNA helicase